MVNYGGLLIEDAFCLQKETIRGGKASQATWAKQPLIGEADALLVVTLNVGRTYGSS